jgi:hypothetical protein
MKKTKINRRNFLSKTLAASAITIVPTNSIKSVSKTNIEAPTLKNKKVLFTYGAWEGHKPKESTEFFGPIIESEGASVIYSDNIEIYANEEKMKSFDLIIQAITMGRIKNSQLKGLSNAVKNGTGFAGWHGGIGDSYRSSQVYQQMVGGQFVSHPGNHIDFDVQISKINDPIINGIKDFRVINSEQYYMLIDPNIKVLAKTYFTNKYEEGIGGSVMPSIWKKNHGKGRVFYNSIGHHLGEFKTIPELMEIQLRGFRWASEGKYHPFENCISPAYDYEL